MYKSSIYIAQVGIELNLHVILSGLWGTRSGKWEEGSVGVVECWVKSLKMSVLRWGGLLEAGRPRSPELPPSGDAVAAECVREAPLLRAYFGELKPENQSRRWELGGGGASNLTLSRRPRFSGDRTHPCVPPSASFERPFTCKVLRRFPGMRMPRRFESSG
jgi:hypothetical protein